jgi:hypothetical protein
MGFPKIIYGSPSATLQFQRPARKVPAYWMDAVRHDNIASSGVREAILERIDNFIELEMEYVGIGADVIAWQAFMAWALAGNTFSYYPDASLAGFTSYWLEDTNWNAGYKHPGQYTFKVKFRQVVT